MLLSELHILNYKNIREATLHFSDKINAFVGLNGQGKTNILDAIYYLSFTKSAYNAIDSQNIHHDEDMAMIQGIYQNINAKHRRAQLQSDALHQRLPIPLTRSHSSAQTLCNISRPLFPSCEGYFWVSFSLILCFLGALLFLLLLNLFRGTVSDPVATVWHVFFSIP